MHAAKKPLFKASSFDITVTKMDLNGHYKVSGKDAAVFYAKLKQIPTEVGDLILGELKDGTFTMQKIDSDSAPTTTAKAE